MESRKRVGSQETGRWARDLIQGHGILFPSNQEPFNQQEVGCLRRLYLSRLCPTTQTHLSRGESWRQKPHVSAPPRWLQKTGSVAHPSSLPVPALPRSPGEQSFGLEETLHRHRQILQTLQGLSKHLAQAEQQWKQQLGSPGQIRPEGGWVSGPWSTQGSACRPGEAKLHRLI